MKQRGHKSTGGYTLIEVLIAMTILGLLTAPICASLVLASRLNARGRAVLEAQLAVRSAVETLMQEKIDPAQGEAQRAAELEERFPAVEIRVRGATAPAEDPAADPRGRPLPYCTVTVRDRAAAGEASLVTVETSVPWRSAEQTEGGTGP